MNGPTVIQPKKLDVFFVHSDEAIAIVSAVNEKAAVVLASISRGKSIDNPSVIKIEPSIKSKVFALIEVEEENV